MNRELADYIREREGFHRLFEALKIKYVSLGRYSGTVTLRNITEEESRDLSNFFGTRIKVGTDYQTSFQKITKKLMETKFKDLDWDGLFIEYFEDNIITKANEKSIKKINEENFFNEIIENNKNNKYIADLKEIINTSNDANKLLRQKYKKNPDKLKIELNNVMLLLNNISNKPITLPVYASLTGNPHFLDLNTQTSNLFFRILSFIKKIEYPSKTKDRVDVLSEINVYIDSISNYVITYKLIGDDMLNVFEKQNQILNLNLDNIMHLENVDTENKKIYIFENPSILNTLKNLNVPIIITSGIPNLAVYSLIKKLEKTGNKLYYNGDFDPEGLLIASKLKESFPNLNLFCYETSNYDDIRTKEKISSSRIKKLDNINFEELKSIKEQLKKYRHAVYQENNIESIKKFIENNN